MMLKDLFKDKKTLISLTTLLFFGFFIRIINLVKIPVFADEAIYVRWSQIMRAEETLRFLPLSDGKQPLYMWITIPFLKIFSDPLFAGRFVSVLSGVGILLGIFVLSYILFNSRKVSIVASLMYLVSPYAFFFDRMALVDSLLSFFGIWTVIFCILAIKLKRLDFAMVSGFMLGGALLTKSPGLFISLLIPFLVYFTPWTKKRPENLKVFFNLIIYYFVIYLIGYGLYNILRLGPNFHLISQRNLDYVFPISHILSDPLNPFIGNLKSWIIWVTYLAPGFIFLLLPVSIVLLFKKNWKILAILLLFISIPLFAQFEYAKVFTARYALLVLPYLFILASFTFDSLNRTIKIFGVIILGLFLLFSLVQDSLLITNPNQAFLPQEERSGYLEDWTAGTGIKETADYLRDQIKQNPGKQIIVGTEGYFGTLPDGLEIYLNDVPQVKIIGVGLDLAQVPASLRESVKAKNDTYLLINDSRLKMDPSKNALSLINSYGKAVRPNGSFESLLFFKVK